MDIIDIAYSEGLTIVETTTEISGYPKNLKKVLIGFDNFEQIEKIAQTYNLQIIEILKKEGQQLYTRKKDHCLKPFSICADDYGNDYRQFTFDDYDNFYTNFVKPHLQDFDDFYQLETFIHSMKNIEDEISIMNEGERLIVNSEFDIVDTVNDNMIEYNIDGTKHFIALIKD